MNITKKRFTAFGATGLVALSIIAGAGVAAAQTSDDDATPDTTDGEPTTTATPGTDSEGFHRHPRHAARHGLGAIVEASGLDGEVFRAGGEEGKTVGTILTENGLDPAAVQADALSALQTRLDEGVAEGRRTQDEADAQLALASEGMTALMDVVPDRPERGERWHGARGRDLSLAAEAIGIEPSALAEALSDGSTIADVAAANGIDVQSVIDAMLAPLFERIDTAVANGEMTAEEAATKKEEATAGVTERVNTPRAEGDEPAGARFGDGFFGGGPIEIADAPVATQGDAI